MAYDVVLVVVVLKTDIPFSFVVKVMKEENSTLMLNVIMVMVMYVSYVHRTMVFFVLV